MRDVQKGDQSVALALQRLRFTKQLNLQVIHSLNVVETEKSVDLARRVQLLAADRLQNAFFIHPESVERSVLTRCQCKAHTVTF